MAEMLYRRARRAVAGPNLVGPDKSARVHRSVKA
jgi:hypothetical protein